MYDILIRGGLVVDGSGKPAFRADVAIRNGKVAEIAPGLSGDAAEIIDAAGLVVSPGFIDCHSHNDYAAFSGLEGPGAGYDSSVCHVRGVFKFDGSKNITFTENNVRILSAVNDTNIDEIKALAEELTK